MKRLYKKPDIEIIAHDYLCQPDGGAAGQSRVEGTEDLGARQFNFDEDEQNEDFFKRFNPWE